jgi:beta-alanine--pyruvate transaminase
MGGVIASGKIHEAFMSGPRHAIELFHGHTYSAHPLACAAGLATLDIYRDEDLFARARDLEKVFEDAVHGLRNAPRVVDIRNLGLAAGIDIEPDSQAPGLRGYEAMRRAFAEENMVIRVSGDTIALAPALIAGESDIARMVEGVRAVLERLS